MEKKINIPQKGAAKKWSEKLREMGTQPPPKDLVEYLSQTERKSKTKKSTPPPEDLDKS